MEQHAEPRNRPTESTDLDREQRQNCRERTVFSKLVLEQLDIHKRKMKCRELPGGPVVSTLCFYSRGNGFDAWLGN